MTLKELVYDLKNDGLSDAEVKVSVFSLLDNEGYVINPTTHLVIEKHCSNWNSQQMEAR